MALADRTEWFVGIKNDGQIELRRTRIILEDGVEINQIHQREVLEPGDALDNYPPRVRQIAQVVWTPQVITNYRAQKTAIVARLPRPTR
jgi:hypothetical protein